MGLGGRVGVGGVRLGGGQGRSEQRSEVFVKIQEIFLVVLWGGGGGGQGGGGGGGVDVN